MSEDDQVGFDDEEYALLSDPAWPIREMITMIREFPAYKFPRPC